MQIAKDNSLFVVPTLFDPSRSYSIGWAHPKSARFLANKMDVISFHGYGKPEKMVNTLRDLKQEFPEKPLMITEIGSTTYSFLGSGFPGSLEKQKTTLENRLNMLNEITDGVMIWTLYDFKHLDPKAIGGTFWNRGIQSNLGIIDFNGQKKSGADAFQHWTHKTLEKHNPS